MDKVKNKKRAREDDTQTNVISDETFKRVKATILRKFGRTFKLLAAYDRGEYSLPRE